MNNFLRVNGVTSADVLYGKDVYITLFPDEQEQKFIYKGRLLGYGAYGSDSDYKTFCVYVERGDGYRFVDYFQDGCFRSKQEYEDSKLEAEKKAENYYTVSRLVDISKYEESHIPVKVKVGELLYPVCGISELASSVREPAFVLTINLEKGERWAIE